MSNTEERLHNLEVAFMTYIGLTKDLLPTEYRKMVESFVFSYDEASMSFSHDIYQVDFKGGIGNE